MGGSRGVPGVPKSVIRVPKLSLASLFPPQTCIHIYSSCRDSGLWHPLGTLPLWKWLDTPLQEIKTHHLIHIMLGEVRFFTYFTLTSRYTDNKARYFTG